MYIEAHFEYFRKGKCFFFVLVFGCACVYCTMQHLHFAKIFIVVLRHLLGTQALQDFVDSLKIRCPVRWQRFPPARCKHTSHSQLMPRSVVLIVEVRRRTPSPELKYFLPSQTWGKQTSSFCWCQRYTWHTTACLRKRHWKDQCVGCYLGLSDSTTRVVVRSCLVTMHRLFAVVCCHSTSIRMCTGRKTVLQRGTWGSSDGFHTGQRIWAWTQFYLLLLCVFWNICIIVLVLLCMSATIKHSC